MAEGLLADRSRRLLEGALRVSSAGTWARNGSPPMPEAIEAAGERGVDIEDLRSTPVSAEGLRKADLLVTMSSEHRDEVLRVEPDVAPKTFTLKELNVLLGALPPADGSPTRASVLARVAQAHDLRTGPDAPWVTDEDVADPLGLGLEAYRAAALEIEDLIDGLVDGLTGARDAAAAWDRED